MTTTAPARDDRPGTSARARRWLVPALLVVLWLVVGSAAGPFAGKLAEVQENDNASFLPASAEATKVNELQRKFVKDDVVPAIVVYERLSGLTGGDRATIAGDVEAMKRIPHVVGEVPPPIPSQDGKAAQVIVPLDAAQGLEIGDAVAKIRDQAQGHAGLAAHVTGPGGILADFSEAFAGIDGLLLVVALAVVFVILVVVYRSPILPFLVLGTAAMALGAASAAIYVLADREVINLNGQSQGILFILVIGACTDYSLLLVSRFREELRRHESRFVAVRVALRASAEPIIASGCTVILGVLCLLFSDLNSNKGLGPVAALGIAASLLTALTFLPAVLALLGRAAFWPFRPAYGSEPAEDRGIWARVAALVGRRPRVVWAVTALGLVIFAAFLPQLRSSGVAQTDVFLVKVDSVAGQEALGRHFPAGAGSPAVIVANAESAEQVVQTAAQVDGVATVVPFTGQPVPANPGSSPSPPKPLVADGLVRIDATLDDPADSEDAVRHGGAAPARGARGERRRRAGGRPDRDPGGRAGRPRGGTGR